MLHALQRTATICGLSTTRSLRFTVHKKKMIDHEIAAEILLSACG